MADVLSVSGVRGTLGARIEATESWGVWWTDIPGAAFYAVTAGTAWLGIPGDEPRQLMPGDVVLLPRGAGHSLTSAPDAVAHSCDATLAAEARRTGTVLRFGDGEVQTHILGAAYEHDPAVSTQVLALLPDVVHLRADNGGGCLDDTVRLLARELAHPQVAAAVVMNSLVNILLVQLLRVWLVTRPAPTEPSWLGVLGDPLMTDALTLIHQDPARAWTTSMLAGELNVSRATLSRRFVSVVGEGPGAYLTRWRMDLAALRLRDSDETLESVAATVGYTSVYAFSRAFSRARGQSPGRFRVAARAAAREVAA
ncbi:AraC family transcriptional regulator [Frondihabitans sucicola]|uniref:AraC family transcriptional regulator n=1 Tax=Frondihabitans sucicola TaxID=1268041 RepID=A0ABM8GUP8_9MICO|nr:AraC family transcriptional regulator [Frondihabitans sucicola]